MSSLTARLNQLTKRQKILLGAGGLIFLCVCLCCPGGFFLSPSSDFEMVESFTDPETEFEFESESIPEVDIPAAPPTLAPPSKLDVSNLHVEYILDASAIMNKPLTDGRSKMEVAAEQVGANLTGHHPGTNLGLRLFGHRYARTDTTGSCQDTELVIAPDRNNHDVIADWLKEPPPSQGLTPLTTSLEEAAHDFLITPERVNAIILVSGSGETCQRDPCALVNQWQVEELDITVYAVGLAAEEGARQQLQCVAEAGGGTYYDAATAADVAHALSQIQQTLKQKELVIPASVAMMPTLTPTPLPTATATRVVAVDTPVPEPSTADPDLPDDGPMPTFTPIPMPPPGSLPSDIRLAFHSHYDDGSGGEIYTIKAGDNSQPVNLTNLPNSDDIGPAWSPDGRRIAFASTRDDPDLANCEQFLYGLGQNVCNYEIYIMNSDGSGLTRLTNHPAVDSNPVWSPDGSRIAFYSTRDGNGELYVINVDGTNLLNLTNHPATDSRAVWSPDSTQVAFTSLRDEPDPETCNQRCNREIYRIKADGSDLQNLTNHPAGDTDPAWSPDGTRLAFSTTRDDVTTEPDLALRAQNCEIYLMNSDGSNPTRLTNLTFCEHSPAWSPDGRQLTFQSWSKEDDETNPYSMIYPCTPTCLISEPGSQAPIDNNSLSCFPGPGSPAGSVWAPDSKYLAFSSCQLPHNIYVLELAGGNVWRLTDAPLSENWGGYTQPTWAPQ